MRQLYVCIADSAYAETNSCFASCRARLVRSTCFTVVDLNVVDAGQRSTRTESALISMGTCVCMFWNRRERRPEEDPNSRAYYCTEVSLQAALSARLGSATPLISQLELLDSFPSREWIFVHRSQRLNRVSFKI